jgi:hypothetical protein
MSLIGKNVVYCYYEGEMKIENRREGNGTIIDKVRLADRFPAAEGGTLVLQHDIYLIENADGSVITMHPSNVKKIVS